MPTRIAIATALTLTAFTGIAGATWQARESQVARARVYCPVEGGPCQQLEPRTRSLHQMMKDRAAEWEHRAGHALAQMEQQILWQAGYDVRF